MLCLDHPRSGSTVSRNINETSKLQNPPPIPCSTLRQGMCRAKRAGMEVSLRPVKTMDENPWNKRGISFEKLGSETVYMCFLMLGHS